MSTAGLDAVGTASDLPDRAQPGLVLVALAAITIGVHVWIVLSGLVPSLIARPLHFAVALPWVFIVAAGSRAAIWSGIAFLAIGSTAAAYLATHVEVLADQYGTLDGSVLQYAVSAAAIITALEMARRAVQPVLPAVAAMALAYGFWGDRMPAAIGHAGVPADYLLGGLVAAEAGLWGQLTAASLELIVPFMILGAFVTAGDAGTGFMSLATRLAGPYRAGAAKVSVLASALYGTISGSASANVASVGTITIPAMKRMGYPAPFAAATEAVASTGGQIMPPVMGAGAFFMAELVRVSYGEIAVASILPAILFFAAAWIGVHFLLDPLRPGTARLGPASHLGRRRQDGAAVRHAARDPHRLDDDPRLLARLLGADRERRDDRHALLC